MSDLPPPTLRLKIDRDALAGNWRALDRLSGRASAGAAVKADCYGLGVDACLPALRGAGAERFFVAHWSEVAAVARHVPPGQISVLHGPLTGADAAYAKACGAVPVINSLAQARRWLDAGGGACDLMIDTGINRLGLAPGEIGDPLIGRLEVNTLMSHLACADEDSEMNARQLATFRTLLPLVPRCSASLANSAGIALGSDYAFDLTRPGLALYGGVPRGELASAIRQVAWPEAAIIQIRNLEPGQSVGYNATFTADVPLRAGVVSIGYADGFLRSWGQGGYLLHGDTRLRLLGKVSMDMVVIDLTSAPQLHEGDWLSLPYALPDAARQSALSQYELLTVLGSRLKQADALLHRTYCGC
ncbi:MAG: alanine racemase [Sphingomonadales bacterium BRH_c42]|nr:MAG: alanine racemase [Sphingomonadales bacterium BRH_c42]